MTDPAVRRELTELFAGQGWPDGGDALLRRSLGPRSPELLLDAPGWLGLQAGGLVLDAGCRDAGHAIALARRYGCRVLGVDLVAAWLPGGLAEAAAAGLAGRVDLVQGDLETLPVADSACEHASFDGGGGHRRRGGSTSSGASGSAASGPSTGWSTIPAAAPRTCWRSPGSPATGRALAFAVTSLVSVCVGLIELVPLLGVPRPHEWGVGSGVVGLRHPAVV
jgi:hypothetical protein